MFPVANGTVKISGADQDLRTSTFIRDSPDKGEEQDNLRGESDRSPSTRRRDSSWCDGEAKSDFWCVSGDFIYRHHEEPRVKLYVPTEDLFRIQLKYMDVTRTIYTCLVVLLKKILKITGTWMDKKNCLMHGQASQDSSY